MHFTIPWSVRGSSALEITIAILSGDTSSHPPSPVHRHTRTDTQIERGTDTRITSPSICICACECVSALARGCVHVYPFVVCCIFPPRVGEVCACQCCLGLADTTNQRQGKTDLSLRSALNICHDGNSLLKHPCYLLLHSKCQCSIRLPSFP